MNPYANSSLMPAPFAQSLKSASVSSLKQQKTSSGAVNQGSTPNFYQNAERRPTRNPSNRPKSTLIGNTNINLSTSNAFQIMKIPVQLDEPARTMDMRVPPVVQSSFISMNPSKSILNR
jgi:hypothetical protein